jgi:hypothetical protein
MRNRADMTRLLSVSVAAPRRDGRGQQISRPVVPSSEIVLRAGCLAEPVSKPLGGFDTSDERHEAPAILT